MDEATTSEILIDVEPETTLTTKAIIILTTQQHVKTIAKPQMAPAVPTTHVRRMNNITPKMF